MYSINDFDECINKVLLIFEEKRFSKGYKIKIKNKDINCNAFKIAENYQIEFAIDYLHFNKPSKDSINGFFDKYIKEVLHDQLLFMSPILKSINYRLIINTNENYEITNIHYKIGFFESKTNLILRFYPKENLYRSFSDNSQTYTINQVNHMILKNFYNINFPDDIVFNSDAQILVKMLII